MASFNFYHYGTDHIDYNKVNRISQPNFLSPNKPNGGLWLSPHYTESNDSWSKFCITNDFGDCRSGGVKVAVDGSRLLIVDDVKHIVDHVGLVKSKVYGDKLWGQGFNWPLLALYYDGLWLTDEGRKSHYQYDLDDPMHYVFDMWDCNSVVLFNTNCIISQETVDGLSLDDITIIKADYEEECRLKWG